MIRIIIGTLLVLWGLSIFLGFSLFKFFFSIAVILFGIRILTGRRWGNRSSVPVIDIDQEDFLNEVIVFGPLFKAVKSEDFKGGKLTMVFAGGELDLSQVKTTAKEIDLHIVTVFSGVKITVPKTWKVNIQSTAIVGGYDNKTTSSDSPVTLNLKGAAVFGGVEIVN
jgi:predicted membrane protein